MWIRHSCSAGMLVSGVAQWHKCIVFLLVYLMYDIRGFMVIGSFIIHQTISYSNFSNQYFTNIFITFSAMAIVPLININRVIPSFSKNLHSLCMKNIFVKLNFIQSLICTVSIILVRGLRFLSNFVIGIVLRRFFFIISRRETNIKGQRFFFKWLVSTFTFSVQCGIF